jgi:WD40 repeat protein
MQHGMRLIFYILVLLVLHDCLQSQTIQVRVPNQVNENYTYRFILGGKYILGQPFMSGTLSNNGKFCLWDARSGRYMHGFDNSNLSNFSSFFSPDANVYALSSSSKTLCIGDVQKDLIIDSLPFHASVSLPYDMQFSSNGDYIIYDPESAGRSVVIYNIRNKKSIKFKGYFIISLTRFSGDGQYAFLFYYENTVQVVRLSDGQVVQTVSLPKEIDVSDYYMRLAISFEDSLIQMISKKTSWLINFSGKYKKMDSLVSFIPDKRGHVIFIQNISGNKQLINYDIITGEKKMLKATGSPFLELRDGGDFVVLKDEPSVMDRSYTAYNKSSNKEFLHIGKEYNKEYVSNLYFSLGGKYYVIETVAAFYLFGSRDTTLIRRIQHAFNPGFQKLDIFFSQDETKMGVKDNINISVYNTKNGLKSATLQIGGDLQNYTILGFKDDSRNIEVNTYGTGGIVQINIDSACIKLARSVLSGDEYAPDGKHFVRPNYFGNISLFDAETNKEIKNMTLECSGFNIKFFAKGKYFASYDPFKFYLFDGRNGNPVWNKEMDADFTSIPFTFDSVGRILIVKSLNTYNIFEVSTGRLIGQLTIKDYITNPIIDETSSFIYIIDTSGKLKIWDIRFGMKASDHTPFSNKIKDLHYTAFADSFRSIKVGNYGAGKFTDTFRRSSPVLNYDRGNFMVRESVDHRLLIVYYAGDEIEVWDMPNKKLATLLDVSNIQVSDIFMDPANKWIVVQGLQKELYIYDYPHKQFVGTFFFFNSTDKQLAFLEDDGYYKIDKGAAENLRFSINGTIYDFDQLDLRYNRPDKILTALGNANTNLIASYYAAYVKRIDKMKVDTSQFTNTFQPPVLEVLNEGELENNKENSKKEIIKIHASDKAQSNYLKRIFLTVNGNPVFGSSGLDIESYHSIDTALSIPVDLATGNNNVKVSCLNNRAVESFRANVNIPYLPSLLPAAKTWFIGIGITNYKEKNYNLAYPVQNILQLDSLFRSNAKADYVSILLLDSMALKKNILAIKDSLRMAAPDDKIIIAFSGHGTPGNLNGKNNFYFVPWDLNIKKEPEHGVSYDEIAWLLDSIACQNKLILLDACFSGDADIDGTTNENFQLMQELFANTGRGNGATIIAASAGNKAAFEPQGFGNSLFIHFILEGLKNRKAGTGLNGEVTVNDLQGYVNKEVSSFSENKQTAASRVVNYDNNWIIIKGQ